MDEGHVSRRTLLLGAGGAALLSGGAVLGKHEIDVHPGLRRLLGFCGSTPSLPPLGSYELTTATLASSAMGRVMPYAVATPSNLNTGGGAGSPLPLILALPGEGGADTDFATRQGLPNYANQAGLRACFVAPGDVGSSYYHPRSDGTDMLTFLIDELVPHIETTHHVGGSRDRRAVYGVSMGGYGALLIAQRYPELVCAAAVGSPAVFPTYQDAITGHSGTFDSEADWQRWGLWNQLATMGRVPVRIDCGDADPFVSTARALIAGIPGATGHIGSGCHSGSFWRRVAPTDIAFLKAHLAA